MTTLEAEQIRLLIENAETPLVFRGFLNNTVLVQWDLNKWCSVFGERLLPFRTLQKCHVTEEPCWERTCETVEMTLGDFMKSAKTSSKSMYFDYKYSHQWLSSDSEFCMNLPWKQFGYPEKGAGDTTLWIGSEGAHTPCHQDTYGFNVVVQLHGKKRWLLFPPNTSGLNPTRVPYEESSIYSEINFFCPTSLKPIEGLSGCHHVELTQGDALLVPRGWWHYVQNEDPVNISTNIWIPHEQDDTTHVSEALVKIMVAQICKDLPQETTKLLVNPNEDDLMDTPLAVLFLQLETVAKAYLDRKRKCRRAKRQKLDESTSTETAQKVDIKQILDNKSSYHIECAKCLSSKELVVMVKGNLDKFQVKGSLEEEEAGSRQSLCLTRALIDAFSESNVIELVKQNLLQKLSS